MGKCVCHINGYEIKDGKSRKAIEELNAKVDALKIPESSVGSGGLTEMQVEDKIADALQNAPLSANQYDAVNQMIENTPAKAPEKQDLRNMNFVNYDDMVWNELVNKVNGLGGEDGGLMTDAFKEELLQYLEMNMYYAMPSNGAESWLKQQFGMGVISADDIVDVNYNIGTSTPISEVYAKKSDMPGTVLASMSGVDTFTVEETFNAGVLVWCDAQGNEHSETIHRPTNTSYKIYYKEILNEGTDGAIDINEYNAYVEIKKEGDSTKISFFKSFIPESFEDMTGVVVTNVRLHKLF